MADSDIVTMYNGHQEDTEDSNLFEYKEKLLEVSLDEEGCESLSVRKGERSLLPRNHGQGRRRVMRDTAGGQGVTLSGENISRSSSIRRGVSGLVRKVSQKVVNNNKGE